MCKLTLQEHNVRNLHFLSKNSTLIPEKIVNFLGEKLVKMWWFWTFQLLTTLISQEKLSKKCFSREVKKILVEKLVKMLGFCQRLFGQKFDFLNSVTKETLIVYPFI